MRNISQYPPSIQMQLQIQHMRQLAAMHRDKSYLAAAAKMQNDAAALAAGSDHSVELILLNRIQRQLDHLSKQVEVAHVQQHVLEEEERVSNAGLNPLLTCGQQGQVS